MLLITVHDKVAGTWTAPAVAQNKDAAIRDFRTALSKSGTILSEHAEDYELWIVGEWMVPYESTKQPTLSVFQTFEYVESGVRHEQ